MAVQEQCKCRLDELPVSNRSQHDKDRGRVERLAGKMRDKGWKRKQCNNKYSNHPYNRNQNHSTAGRCHSGRGKTGNVESISRGK